MASRWPRGSIAGCSTRVARVEAGGYTAAWAEGEAMPLERAIADALEDAPDVA